MVGFPTMTVYTISKLLDIITGMTVKEDRTLYQGVVSPQLSETPKSDLTSCPEGMLIRLTWLTDSHSRGTTS